MPSRKAEFLTHLDDLGARKHPRGHPVLKIRKLRIGRKLLAARCQEDVAFRILQKHDRLFRVIYNHDLTVTFRFPAVRSRAGIRTSLHPHRRAFA